ncbi:MAG: hypothetical protein HGB22_11155 [Chlorobiaceae bacterium]|nr:hypothetical protein [Chlorobiaceae bacterium]
MPLAKLIEEMKKTVMPHAIAAHFSNGLIPVAVLYLLLAFPTRDPFFERTVEHLLVIVCLAIPVSFLSGIRDWKTKYKGAKAPVFTTKIRLSILLFALCLIAVSIRLSVSDVMSGSGILFWIYSVDLLSMLPVVVFLGHYGGKLSAGQRSEKFR